MRALATLFITSLVFITCEIPSRNLGHFAYIQIDDLKLKVASNQGADSDNFKDAWVFVDGRSNGVYEIPRKVPIAFEAGSSTLINIQAGIRENGVNSAPIVFPFVNTYQMNLEFDDLETVNLQPVFEYIPETKFRIVEDFEGSNRFTFDEDRDTSTLLTLSNSNPASGLFSGEIIVPGTDTVEIGSTLVYNEIPVNGTPVFLEIEYYGDVDLDIGLIGEKGGQFFKDYFVSLRSEREWKKAYINLTSLVVASGLEGYQVLMRAINQDEDEAMVLVDNIKLLHF